MLPSRSSTESEVLSTSVFRTMACVFRKTACKKTAYRMIAVFLAVILLCFCPGGFGGTSIAESFERSDEAAHRSAASDGGRGPVVGAPSHRDLQELSDPCEDAEDKLESGFRDEGNAPLVAFFARESSYSDIPALDLAGRYRYRRDRARGPPLC